MSSIPLLSRFTLHRPSMKSAISACTALTLPVHAVWAWLYLTKRLRRYVCVCACAYMLQHTFTHIQAHLLLHSIVVMVGTRVPQKFRDSHWCVPFTATFSKRRKIGALWSEHCDTLMRSLAFAIHFGFTLVAPQLLQTHAQRHMHAQALHWLGLRCSKR